jgi:O-acetylhomoserine/O-acetylserine sulfhydrylase-like pyridoxal-dependent enzyme
MLDGFVLGAGIISRFVDGGDRRAMRAGGALRGHLVRFSIGLEEEGALRADLAQAIAQAFG